MLRTAPRPARKKTRSTYSAPALEKGIDIIELLADNEAGLTVSEIAKQLGRPMSELFRVIRVMESRNWLRKDPDTALYSLTYHVLRLAHRGTPAQTLSAAAAPVMYELSTRINQSCHLVVLSGSQGMVILRQENQKRHATLSVRVGAPIDLTSSCSGHVLLAQLSPEQLENVLDRIPRPWKVSRVKLMKTVERVRKRRYDQLRSPITAGVTDISYPIRGFDGAGVAALTIPYLHVLDKSLPTTVEQTRRLLAEASTRISATLGWS
jgi:DNA-binding IclR family transcriptional regulator